MNTIGSYSIILVLFLAAMLIFIIAQRSSHMGTYSQELKQTVLEASAIRDELEKMMENSLSISELIVDRLDTGASSANHSLSREEDLLAVQEEESTSSLLPLGEKNVSGVKVRIYELARDLEMNSKELIQLLKDMGYSYSHHMNQLSQETAKIIKAKILENNPASPPASLLETDVFTEEETAIKEERPLDEFSLLELRTAHPYLAVRSLHEKGYSVKEIAQILERGQGEVSLILNLTQKKSVI
ncbi:MAG: translation initiation factor IF-2 N-terminal domain-containing protein [Syntrophomonas sp.]|uniref:translation initiation factor IF-2 N-terminal domain-containing protein n=1 Tax=Syntrophomonas sp. TaxID=2053627 RepID=UPI0026336CF5|nr:translation initiation factor IF-2 N-terminal domain-containing protein [Syntrophomonas sp.]MDD2510036.1 translation initiation factor IF-2 N-terminal domain-containing protein [Syntrophomonas sp.]MDD3878626.1 translation initiation factor IF-2 N-terminal domain-containing protein [Syntrophomonas sp.]MDD4626087.1 translation initiation factor IF-2 N-terminal domain-containing protein [Syntrophomonas sp.]